MDIQLDENTILLIIIFSLLTTMVFFIFDMIKKGRIEADQAEMNEKEHIQEVGNYNRRIRIEEKLAEQLDLIDKSRWAEANKIYQESLPQKKRKSKKDIYDSLFSKYFRLANEAKKASGV